MPGTFVSVASSTTKNAVPEEDWRRCEDVRGGMYGRISCCCWRGREDEAAMVAGQEPGGTFKQSSQQVRISFS